MTVVAPIETLVRYACAGGQPEAIDAAPAQLTMALTHPLGGGGPALPHAEAEDADDNDGSDGSELGGGEPTAGPAPYPSAGAGAALRPAAAGAGGGFETSAGANGMIVRRPKPRKHNYTGFKHLGGLGALQWSFEEDELLRAAIALFGTADWTKVAAKVRSAERIALSWLRSKHVLTLFPADPPSHSPAVHVTVGESIEERPVQGPVDAGGRRSHPRDGACEAAVTRSEIRGLFLVSYGHDSLLHYRRWLLRMTRA